MDIETLKDLTADEFRYVLGNVLRSNRYGAISSRIGKVKNILAGVIFSDCELFSNLELTQAVYDRLRGNGPELDFPLRSDAVVEAMRAAAGELSQRVVGQLTILPPDEVAALVDEITAFYRDEDAVCGMLEETTGMYGPQG
jgi:CRISPR-associated protein Csc2